MNSFAFILIFKTIVLTLSLWCPVSLCPRGAAHVSQPGRGGGSHRPWACTLLCPPASSVRLWQSLPPGLCLAGLGSDWPTLRPPVTAHGGRARLQATAQGHPTLTLAVQGETSLPVLRELAAVTLKANGPRTTNSAVLQSSQTLPEATLITLLSSSLRSPAYREIVPLR